MDTKNKFPSQSAAFIFHRPQRTSVAAQVDCLACYTFYRRASLDSWNESFNAYCPNTHIVPRNPPSSAASAVSSMRLRAKTSYPELSHSPLPASEVPNETHPILPIRTVAAATRTAPHGISPLGLPVRKSALAQVPSLSALVHLPDPPRAFEFSSLASLSFQTSNLGMEADNIRILFCRRLAHRPQLNLAAGNLCLGLRDRRHL